MINTQEQYDNDDKQYAKFIRFLKENNVFLPWKERVMKRNNLEPSFNIKKMVQLPKLQKKRSNRKRIHREGLSFRPIRIRSHGKNANTKILHTNER